MFILKNVGPQHVGKWVITKPGDDTIVAYDADVSVALGQARKAGVEEPATIVFVHELGVPNIYVADSQAKRIREMLGDQSKGISVPTLPFGI